LSRNLEKKEKEPDEEEGRKEKPAEDATPSQ